MLRFHVHCLGFDRVRMRVIVRIYLIAMIVLPIVFASIRFEFVVSGIYLIVVFVRVIVSVILSVIFAIVLSIIVSFSFVMMMMMVIMMALLG